MLINNNETEKEYFKRYSNKLSKLKTLSKKMYFQNELSKCKQNPQKAWKIIKSTLPNSSCCHFPNSIKINDTTTKNPTTISNEFNNYCCSIGSKLTNNISRKTKKKPYEFLNKKISSFIYLEAPSVKEILNHVLSLNDSKAIGHDDIPAYVLKVCSTVIAPYLQIFTNFIFTIMAFSLITTKFSK